MKRGDFCIPAHESKRAKLQLNSTNVDDVWGDDPEIEEFDKCINLATQICQDQPNDCINNTISYDDFKAKKVCSSTQMTVKNSLSTMRKDKQFCNAEVSFFRQEISTDQLLQQIAELKDQNKKLEDAQRTSTGEVTILRAQLTQAHKDIEQERLEKIRTIEATNQKWNLKLINATKDSESSKNYSDLKELEIANLKEKLAEVKKSHTITLNTTQGIMNDMRKQSHENINQNRCNKSSVTMLNGYTTFEPIYPLEQLIPESYFDQCMNEDSCNSTKYRRKRNEGNCEKCLHSEVILLRKYTQEQLNSLNMLGCTNKILFVVRESMLTLYKKLKNSSSSDKGDLKTSESCGDDKNSVQNNYCIFSKVRWQNCESFVDLRRSIAICANLLLYSDTLYGYFTGRFQKSLDFNFVEQSNVAVPIHNSDFHLIIDDLYDFDFLNIVLNIFKLIAKNNRSTELSGFIASVLKLLSNLGKKQLNDECCVIINVIFKTIISSSFERTTVRYICEFLKCFSRYSLFVLLLCKMCHVDYNKKLFKEETPKDDVCYLQMLTKQLHRCYRDVQINCDIIQFLLNTISLNEFWECSAENERCTCLAEIYSIICNILYNSLDNYLSEISTTRDKFSVQNYKNIFRMGILFLDVLILRYPELIGRCSRLYYQYQAILKKLNNIRDSLNLEAIHQTALAQLLSQLYIDVQNIEDTSDVSTDTIFEETFATF